MRILLALSVVAFVLIASLVRADAQSDAMADACLAKAMHDPSVTQCVAAQHGMTAACKQLVLEAGHACLDEETAKQLAAIQAEADRVAAEKEAKCQASAECTAKRYACWMVASRADLVQQIARERANPSGVVDLRRLHELGQLIQSADAQIPGLRAHYVALAHRPLVCP